MRAEIVKPLKREASMDLSHDLIIGDIALGIFLSMRQSRPPTLYGYLQSAQTRLHRLARPIGLLSP